MPMEILKRMRMFPKSKRHRSKKILDSARGQQCALRLPCCNHNPETTVFAHYQFTGGKMGGKPSDIFGCYSCSDCHDLIDGKNELLAFDMQTLHGINLSWEKGRAKDETQQILLDLGLIKI